jgi:hypothetical protein
MLLVPTNQEVLVSVPTPPPPPPKIRRIVVFTGF